MTAQIVRWMPGFSLAGTSDRTAPVTRTAGVIATASAAAPGRATMSMARRDVMGRTLDRLRLGFGA